jgi:hypothetical protein
MILDIRTDKTVAEMDPVRIADAVSEWHRDYRDRYIERRGRWHVVYEDRSEGYLWGEDLIFLP